MMVSHKRSDENPGTLTKKDISLLVTTPITP